MERRQPDFCLAYFIMAGFNKCIYMGRLVKDPDVRATSGENSRMVASYVLAVDRPGKDSEADFVNCEVWNAGATFAEKYLKQGMRILVCGSTRTGSYTNKQGQKVYTTVCLVSEQHFADSKRSDAPADEKPVEPAPQEFMNIPDGVSDMGVPFN